MGEAERPRCANCGKPAIVLIGGSYPACIDCQHKHETTQSMEFAKLAALLNHSLAEIDALAPFGLPLPRLQIPRPPMPPINVNSPTVTVTNSTVGAINTGNVGEISVNLQSLAQNGAHEIADLLEKLTTAIVTANDADMEAKNGLLELVAELTAHANRKPEERKASVIRAVLSGITTTAQTISSVAVAWAAAAPVLEKFFSS